jgi:hypothetical protein
MWTTSWKQIQVILLILVTRIACENVVVGAVMEENVVDKHLEQAQAVFEWVATSEGAFVNPKQMLRRGIPGDVNSPLGVYATDRIEVGEILTHVPWDIIIKSDYIEEEEGGEQLSCGLVKNLAHELRLGNKSKYAPYVSYLNDEPLDQIPSMWTNAAKELLLQVLNDSIPPSEAVDWIKRSERCHRILDVIDEFVTKAVLLIIQRSDDALMIGSYDSYNHRNPPWTNTKTTIKRYKYHETVATKTIQAGEEIYLSYNRCAECEGRYYEYGTAGKSNLSGTSKFSKRKSNVLIMVLPVI